MPRFTANVFSILLDQVEAMLLAFCWLIALPLGFLRSRLALSRSWMHFRVLSRYGLLSDALRVKIDLQIGMTDRAIAGLESLIGMLEEAPGRRARQVVLLDLYALLARSYLKHGHVDDAAFCVIRANKSLSCDRLPGLPELDARTAQIIKAGIAAGRLLDEGGQATLLVHQPLENPSSVVTRRRPAKKSPPKLHKLNPSDKSDGAKILPFPPTIH